MGVTQIARAKVNLTLKVLGRRADGYHALESLVTFAAIGDRLTFDPGLLGPRLVVRGPFAEGIAGPNLLDGALELLSQSGLGLGDGSITLEKNLPVAAGLGGGSADAGALLRLARAAHIERAEDPLWRELARRLGADVPVCFADRPALMGGIGDELQLLTTASSPPLPLPAVLANPGVPLATARVFAALQAPPLTAARAPRAALAPIGSFAALCDHIGAVGNDLEPPAMALEPVIGAVKAALRACPGCRTAAMSGSGPTCFGIFTSEVQAMAAAVAMRSSEPRWWVVATLLDGVVASAAA
jgi:4-diphosphocytidyl-2-C-methyl-D-erythritol kinase